MANNLIENDTERALSFATFREMLYNKFKNIAVNLFKWKNLPDGIDSRILENQIFEYGQVAFVDGKVGQVILPMSAQFQFDVYRQPTRISVYGLNYQETFNKPNFVIIRNRYYGDALARFIDIYALKLADIDFTIRMQLNAHKVPLIFKTDKHNFNTMKRYFEAIQTYKPSVYQDKNKMGTEAPIEVLNADIQYKADKLFDLYQSYVGEILTHLGINNNPIEKRERVQSAEVDSNNEYIHFNLLAMLEPRQDAVERINERYGTNIEVEVNEDFIKQVEQDMAQGNNLSNVPDNKNIAQGGTDDDA